MTTIDLVFILIYFTGVVVIGAISSARVKDSSDMFNAGRGSQWWVAGLSGYMTIFSAGTFVVWGGIAYRLGMVAVSILMTIGLSLILVGVFVAGKWREIGIKSPAEFLSVRFGQKTVKLYTILGIVARGVSMSVALYAVSILLVALVPLPEGHLLADAATGNLSVGWAVLAIGIIAVGYTAAGGLWAVMMTDVVQFILLVLMVVILVPLSFYSVGGVGAFIEQAPKDFFLPVGGEYTFIWLILWFFVWFFQLSGDWPFVQRYISVPTAKDSKKVAYLMGALYVISPLIWLIPSMVYRMINPDANPEQSYILISQQVLPAGMLGLMMATMISATMSMVDSMLNVFAGVFTNDIYKPMRPRTSEKALVGIGRAFTLIYGAIVMVFAMMIPSMGGAEKVVVTLMTLVIGPMVVPSVWGLFSRRINQKTVWLTLGVAYTLGAMVKFGLSPKGVIAGLWDGGVAFAEYAQNNPELMDAIIGLVIPVLILSATEITTRKRGEDAGWKRFVNSIKENNEEEQKIIKRPASKLPRQIVVWSLIGLGAGVGFLAIISDTQQRTLMVFSLLLFLIPTLLLLNNRFINKMKKRSGITASPEGENDV